MCKFSSKSGGVPFQPLGDLTWNDPIIGSEIAIDDPKLGGFWVEICHQFSALLLLSNMIADFRSAF